MIRTISEGFASLIFPPNCLVCRRYHSGQSLKNPLCPSCLELIQRNCPPLCVRCGRPVAFGLRRCHLCTEHPVFFDFAWSACLYDETLKNLLLQFKYNHATIWRHLFAELMIRYVEDRELDIRQFECLIPVPLFPSRLRERGYNQSLLLAEIIGRAYNIPVRTDILIRCRPSVSQTLLNEKDRWTNIRSAFRINPLFPKTVKKALIVDDLLTTGATVSEAARTLKLAHVKRVGVLTLATAG